ncbi:MAG: glutamine--fructose-6-phosphate transaminase (isomerizing), partial [Thermodesulfobacteriota bacterium]
KGGIGLGHTRWATHGVPNNTNAHPHCDCSGSIALVHNGIIENYQTLKEELIANGHTFRSDTDTEVLSHLIESHFNGSLEESVRLAMKEVRGSYAMCVISSRDPRKIVAVRKDSPLILGVGQGEYFIASDIPAFLGHTRDVVFLEDGEMAVLEETGIKVLRLPPGGRIRKKIQHIPWDSNMAEKGGYKHFMLKEIFEQPRAIMETMRGRVLLGQGEVMLGELPLTPEEIRGIRKIFLVSCGTSYHASLVGKFLIEEFSRIPVEVDLGSEFRYRSPLIDKEMLMVAISQSGETADTLAAVREARARGAKIISICNAIGSTITRESDGTLYLRAGPEIGVASTKAFTCQLTALVLLAVHLGIVRGVLSTSKAREILDGLAKIPRLMDEVLRKSEELRELVGQYCDRRSFLYLGRGINYPLALEGALKLKEISYIHAEGYPAGEMKHGPIALIDRDMPVVVLAPRSKVYGKVMGNIEEAKARGATIISVATEDDEGICNKSDHVFYIPATLEALNPILLSPVLQLLAYHIADLKGCDVDQPRNLAKSVTVE